MSEKKAYIEFGISISEGKTEEELEKNRISEILKFNLLVRQVSNTMQVLNKEINKDFCTQLNTFDQKNKYDNKDKVVDKDIFEIDVVEIAEKLNIEHITIYTSCRICAQIEHIYKDSCVYFENYKRQIKINKVNVDIFSNVNLDDSIYYFDSNDAPKIIFKDKELSFNEFYYNIGKEHRNITNIDDYYLKIKLNKEQTNKEENILRIIYTGQAETTYNVIIPDFFLVRKNINVL